MKPPESGSLRVYVIVNVPNKPTHYPVNSWEHGKRLIEALAESQLLDLSITSNVFGLEVFEDGEWMDWENSYGESINEAEIEA